MTPANYCPDCLSTLNSDFECAECGSVWLPGLYPLPDSAVLADVDWIKTFARKWLGHDDQYVIDGFGSEYFVQFDCSPDVDKPGEPSINVALRSLHYDIPIFVLRDPKREQVKSVLSSLGVPLKFKNA